MTLAALPAELEKVRKLAQRLVLPIKEATNETQAENDFLFTAVRADASRELPEPHLIYFLLVELLGFKNLGKFEKLAWSVPIEFDGAAYLVEHRKFGVGVFMGQSEGQEDAARQIVCRIKKAVRYAEPFLDGRQTLPFKRRS